MNAAEQSAQQWLITIGPVVLLILLSFALFDEGAVLELLRQAGWRL